MSFVRDSKVGNPDCGILAADATGKTEGIWLARMSILTEELRESKMGYSESEVTICLSGKVEFSSESTVCPRRLHTKRALALSDDCGRSLYRFCREQ